MLTTVASFIHLRASSVSNVIIIKETVVVLFISRIGEYIYLILHIIFPAYLQNIENNFDLNKRDPYRKKIESKQEQFLIICDKIDTKIKEIEQNARNEVDVIKSLYHLKGTDEETQIISEHDFSQWQKMFEDKKAKMIEIRDTYKTQINSTIQGRIHMNGGDSKTQKKITHFFKPRI